MAYPSLLPKESPSDSAIVLRPPLLNMVLKPIGPAMKVVLAVLIVLAHGIAAEEGAWLPQLSQSELALVSALRSSIHGSSTEAPHGGLQMTFLGCGWERTTAVPSWLSAVAQEAPASSAQSGQLATANETVTFERTCFSCSSPAPSLLVICDGVPKARGRYNVHGIVIAGATWRWSITPRVQEFSLLQSLSVQDSTAVGLLSVAAKLTTLTFLDVMRASGLSPASLSALTRLEVLRISSSWLRGSIDELGIHTLPYLRNIDFSGNEISGQIPETLGSPEIAYVNLRGNKLEQSIPKGFFSKSKLGYVNLGSNELNGSIPDDFGLGSNLFYLNLDYNRLHGSVPFSLASVTTLGILLLSENWDMAGPLPSLFQSSSYSISQPILALSNTSINGSLPRSLEDFARRVVLPPLLVVTNSRLSGPVPYALHYFTDYGNGTSLCGLRDLPSCPPQHPIQWPAPPFLSPSLQSSRSLHPGIVAAIVVGILAPVTIITLYAWCWWGRVVEGSDANRLEAGSQKDQYSYVADDEEGSKKGPKSKGSDRTKLEGPILFSLRELLQATNGFHPDVLLGRGGFGHVFKGTITGLGSDILGKDQGLPVAIKVLTRASGGNVQGERGEKEFEAEVEFLSLVRHRNLVRLVGFCLEGDHRMLVYEFVSRGNLASHLHEGRGRPLPWMARVRIASGVASGLSYLHEGCQPRIVHRDIKPSNILLDEKFEPKISDFGLARVVPEGVDDVSTQVQGTKGYVAPEYLEKQKIAEKVDVYSYGVVMLELVTGRSPFGNVDLTAWVLAKAKTGMVEEIADPALHGDYNLTELKTLVHIALMCTTRKVKSRPYMSQVVQMLQGDILPNTIDALNYGG